MSEPVHSTSLQQLSRALSRAERCVTRQLAQALDEEGFTVEQWRILLLLADGCGHTMTEIAEFALVPAPSLTRLIDRLTVDGLVHRSADMRDRRRVLVHLTRRGVALYHRLSERVERERHAVLDGAEPGEAERLLTLLGGLVDRLR